MERISDSTHKVFILLNEGLADQPTDKLDYSLRQDMEQVGLRTVGWFGGRQGGRD